MADEAAASRLLSALQQDFFSLLRNPTMLNVLQCLEPNMPSLTSYFHISYCLCPLRCPCPLLHSVTQHLQVHTGTCVRTTALRLTHLNPLP